MNGYLKQGLGRWLPAYPSLVKNDPFWLEESDPHRSSYVREGLIDQTVVNYPVFNPGYAECNATADLGLGRGRRDQKRLDAGAGGGKSLEEDGNNPGEISDRAELRGDHGERIGHRGRPPRSGAPVAVCALGAAACRAPNMPGRLPSVSPMSPYSSPLSPIPLFMVCGSATSQASMSNCGKTRSFR